MMSKCVLITGATGLIGSEIVRLCHNDGIAVNFLTTSKHKLSADENYKGFHWNPISGQIDKTCLDGVDTIINLVGASIAKRWTKDYKKEILQSRTKSAELLQHTMRFQEHQVKQVVSASAIGIYPSSLTKYYEEDATEQSNSFLGDVVVAWEKSVEGFMDLGCKLSKVRIGVVLAKDGGALPQIVKPIKYGAGAAFGSGEQWQSWIHIEDLARIFLFLMKEGLEGVYNGVAPNAVTNSDLTKIVAEHLGKPLVLPNVPKFAMSLALGEMHILLFESQRVSSRKMEEAGFMFKYSNLRPAIEDLLG